MGWFGRKKTDAANARPDILALLDEHAERGDVAAILQACNTLNGLGSILFGIPVHQVTNPDAVKTAAVAALARALERVPIAQAETVLAAAGRATIPIDLAPLRTRLAAAAAPAYAQIEAALAGMTEVAALIAACEQLDAGGTVAGIYYGRSWPDRSKLFDRACARLVDTIAKLPPDRARAAIIDIRRADLEIALDGVSDAVSHVDSDEPLNPEIEAAIDANPDDAETYAVLGDWLSERDHIRGELIALHLGAETDPGLAPTAAAYVEEHAEALLGVLADLPGDHVVWRRGFVDEMKLVADDEILIHEKVPALLDHPSGRRLRTLALVPGYDEMHELDAAIRAVVDRSPRHLRRLVLGDEQLARVQPMDLAPLWSHLPKLTTLVVRGAFKAVPIRHAHLTRLEVETVALSRAEASAIAAADLPALEYLDLWFGMREDEYEDDGEDGESGVGASLTDAVSLLARTDWPRLTHLGLINTAFTDELCGALAAGLAPLARQLVELDLSNGTMSQAGVNALISAARNLPKLEKLCVSDNYLDESALARLRKTFRNVTSGAQRQDHGDRYPAVME
jgi:uncharacterized protein (TIGR02996 family)